MYAVRFIPYLVVLVFYLTTDHGLILMRSGQTWVDISRSGHDSMSTCWVFIRAVL